MSKAKKTVLRPAEQPAKERFIFDFDESLLRWEATTICYKLVGYGRTLSECARSVEKNSTRMATQLTEITTDAEEGRA